MKINVEDREYKLKKSKENEIFSSPDSNNICFLFYSNISLLFLCLIGYFSYLYSTDQYYLGYDSECSLLKNWVYAYSWYCFILIAKEVFYLSMSILDCFGIPVLSGYSILLSQIFSFIISTIASSILNIGMTIILLKYNELCGSCRTLAIILVSFYWIKITLASCILIFCCRYCGFSSLMNSIMAITGRNKE